jgi:hypothetical protein
MAERANPGGAARHRLFLLSTALVARGMEPAEAYRRALRYVEGDGRGRTWIQVLAECEAAPDETALDER